MGASSFSSSCRFPAPQTALNNKAPLRLYSSDLAALDLPQHDLSNLAEATRATRDRDVLALIPDGVDGGDDRSRPGTEHFKERAIASVLLDFFHVDLALGDGQVGGQAGDGGGGVRACEGEDRVAGHAGKDEVLEWWGDELDAWGGTGLGQR